MIKLLAIAGGGAIGAVLRFWVSTGIHVFASRDFPYGTLAANVVGSLLMGLLSVLLLERLDLAPEWRSGVLVGMLGAFTTFSTFSLETLNLLEQGEGIKALLNVVASVTLCLSAAFVGLLMGRQL